VAALAVTASVSDETEESEGPSPPAEHAEPAEPVAESIAYSSTRARMLRELVLLQEIRSDVTEAEFALELSRQNTGKEGEELEREREAASINLPRLYERLSTAIDVLSASGFEFAGLSSDEIDVLVNRLEEVQFGLGKAANECLLPGGGGVDECEEREERDMVFAETVQKRMNKLRTSVSRFAGRAKRVPGEGEPSEGPPGEAVDESSLADGTAVYFRDDGTVDWDAAMETGREVAKFGNELWDRVNGVDQEGMISAEKQRQEFLRSPVAQEMLVEIRAIGENIAEKEKVWRETYRKGPASKIAPAEPAALVELRVRKLILETNLSMELVTLYIQNEIGLVSTVPDDIRYLIAEFGLLDSQVQQIVTAMKSGAPVQTLQLEVYVLAADVEQLVKRLGLLELPPFQVSWTKIQLQIQSTMVKMQNGLGFVGRGIRMLGLDCWYTLSLVGQAIKGNILTPREVRCVRRTLKDLLTLIPYSIILAIPMTPVGHVVVFNVIQRLFPGFCPSTFTERRQNLASLYDAVRTPDESDLENKWFVRKPSVVAPPAGREIPKFRFTDKKSSIFPSLNFSEIQSGVKK
jgi:hypothetical protein